MLAYYLYPFIPNQDVKEYSKEDLMDPKKVEELFEIDKRSGWLSDRTENTLEEYIEWVKYEISIAVNE